MMISVARQVPRFRPPDILTLVCLAGGAGNGLGTGRRAFLSAVNQAGFLSLSPNRGCVGGLRC